MLLQTSMTDQSRRLRTALRVLKTSEADTLGTSERPIKLVAVYMGIWRDLN